MKTWSLFTTAIACALLPVAAQAQRGVGGNAGVARQIEKPETLTVTGRLLEIKTAINDKTTGRSPAGTHLLVETAKGEKLNIHLGPATAVADTVAKLTVGDKLSVTAFRTDDMAAGDYTAQTIVAGKNTFQIRDETLRPAWAGGRGRGRAAIDTTDDTTTKPAAKPAPAAPGCPRGCGGFGPPWARDPDNATPPRGAGLGRGVGRGADDNFAADRDVFHYLLSNHDKIKRKVKNLEDGIETVTESDDEDVASAIQEHVAAMKERVEKMQPIHLRDPLFAALFGQANKIEMKIVNTKKGARVVETSSDPYVAKLIQAHAAVVSKFVANGFAEAQQNHAVPKP